MTGPMLHTVDVDSDAGTIYEAITTKAGEAAFWTSDCDIEPVVGSIARFGFPGAPVDLRMRIDELSPGERIRWSCLGDFPHWAGTTVTWTLSPAPSGSGTAVAFNHEGWNADYPDDEYARVNYTWGRIVGALKAYAESGSQRRSWASRPTRPRWPRASQGRAGRVHHRQRSNEATAAVRAGAQRVSPVGEWCSRAVTPDVWSRSFEGRVGYLAGRSQARPGRASRCRS